MENIITMDFKCKFEFNVNKEKINYSYCIIVAFEKYADHMGYSVCILLLHCNELCDNCYFICFCNKNVSECIPSIQSS